jgi:hypothetical protein
MQVRLMFHVPLSLSSYSIYHNVQLRQTALLEAVFWHSLVHSVFMPRVCNMFPVDTPGQSSVLRALCHYESTPNPSATTPSILTIL